MHQQHASMKVCTDACLFGAWVAKDQDTLQSKNILDIGTGTGLLSLMLAQANPNANITAVEIEDNAAKEAVANFKLSDWNNRLHLVHDSIQNFSLVDHNERQFDIIVSNPPFYEGDLKSPDPNKNIAAHSTDLPWTILVEKAAHLLMEGGAFFVLTPVLRAYTMQKICDQHGLSLVDEVLVQNTAKNLPIRAMQKFVKNKVHQHTPAEPMSVKRTKLIIKDENNQYEVAFSNCLQDYYLHL